MKNLYMLIGVPGSGKSTFIKTLMIDNPKIHVLSTDNYIQTYADWVSRSYNDVFAEKIKEAQNFMNGQIEEILKDENEYMSVVWDQTNVTTKSRRAKLARFEGYNKVAVFFDHRGREDVVLSRNNERKKIGRSIPEHVIMSMMNSIEAPQFAEGFTVIIDKKVGD